MESVLSTLLKLAKENRLRVYPSNTEMILFIRKYEIPSFTLLRLDGIKRNKLSRKRNSENLKRKALCAFYICKKTLGKR